MPILSLSIKKLIKTSKIAAFKTLNEKMNIKINLSLGTNKSGTNKKIIKENPIYEVSVIFIKLVLNNVTLIPYSGIIKVNTTI